MKRAAPAVALLAFVLCACAAQRGGEKSPPAAAPSSGAPASYPQQQGEPGSHDGAPDLQAPSMQPTPTGTALPPGPPAVTPPEDPRRREAALRAARSEVDRTSSDLEASLSDCANACRALASLERAAGHLCELASEIEDRRKCEDAKTRVQSARARIRASCGTCPGGPSLEKTAPIPSR